MCCCSVNANHYVFSCYFVGVDVNVQLTAFTCRNSVKRKIWTKSFSFMNSNIISVDIDCFDDFQKFPDLKFKYVEEESPEEFFIPYVWSLVYHASNMYFNASRILLFSLSASWGRPGWGMIWTHLNLNTLSEHGRCSWYEHVLVLKMVMNLSELNDFCTCITIMYMFLLMNWTDLQYMYMYTCINIHFNDLNWTSA